MLRGRAEILKAAGGKLYILPLKPDPSRRDKVGAGVNAGEAEALARKLLRRLAAARSDLQQP